MKDESIIRIRQFFFSIMSHKIYDFGLYRFVSTYIWKYDSQKIIKSYKQNVSNNHLEIGVGTGYLIKNSIEPRESLTLTLMDLNESCLKKSAIELISYSPYQIKQNILEPFANTKNTYDSIGMNYVLHCVQGDFKSKGIVFDHVYSALSDGGVFFGATILTEGVNNSFSAKILIYILNMLCIFSNNKDSFKDFSDSLNKQFMNVEINKSGSVVYWKAQK